MAIPKLNKSTWTIITAIPVVIAVITGVWKIDDRYAKAADIKETEVLVAEGLKQTTQTIKNNYMLSKLYAINELIDAYDREIAQLERELKRDPNDREINKDLEGLKSKRNNLIKKRDALLEKLAGVE